MADTAVQQAPNLPKTPNKPTPKKTPISEKGSEAPVSEKKEAAKMPSRVEEEATSQVADTGKFTLRNAFL